MASLIVTILSVIGCNQKVALNQPVFAKKKIAVILAHPDDETAVGQVLAKYARLGHEVQLMIAADGRYGVEAHAGIPAGDSLAALRANESRCACNLLGIEPPIFFGLHDGFGVYTDLGLYFNQTNGLKKQLKHHLDSINPDMIITFGPDGDTGHPDHRGIGDIVTEVVLAEGWYDRFPIYYIGWLKEKAFDIPQGNMVSLNYVDQKYLNVRIPYEEEDLLKLFNSLSCYKTQLTVNDVEEWIKAERLDTSFIFNFRKLAMDTIVQNDFFDIDSK